MISGSRDTVRRARKLRREMTLPERILWSELRKSPNGLKFRRQHPAGSYVLDFYCAAARLAIEVDGIAHDSATAVARDKRRSAWLRFYGIATTRIPARLVLNDLEAVVTRIVEICRKRTEKTRPRDVPLHQPEAGPPPRLGRLE